MSEPKGYVSVWRKSSGKLKAAGSVQITPEALIALADLPVNDRGQITLDIALFTNDKEGNERRPDYTGYLQPPRQQSEQKQQQSQEPNWDSVPF